jgi:hypothetical protein
MHTRPLDHSRFIHGWLALISVAFVASCFSTPSPDIANRICTTAQQCPTGYSCLAPGKAGGCCKPGTLVCPVPLVSDAAGLEVSPGDLRLTSPMDTANSEGGGALPVDASLGIELGIDRPKDGPIDANGPGAPDGAAAGGTGGSVDTSGTGGSDGSSAKGGNTGAGGISMTGGTSAQGGVGGALDAGLPDAPADAPIRDLAAEGPSADAPGTCSTDIDCPSQSPLCLAKKCAKCAGDSDCASRTATPACAAGSGLCVACTANSYCTADLSKGFCVANACAGCSAAGAGGCNGRTDGKTTCATSGTAAGQCVACMPSETQCSATGVPQLCTGSGVWQDQAKCLTNYACSAAMGTCTCAKTACSGNSCVDTATDASNCGVCGHNCLGGPCLSGQCQPAVVANNLGANPQVIGVDSSNVYYRDTNSVGAPQDSAHRVSKTAVAGSSSTLMTWDYPWASVAVIGSNLFSGFHETQFSMCGITSLTSCPVTNAPLPGLDTLASSEPLVPFRSPSPQYFAQYDLSVQGTMTFSWYDTNYQVVKTYSQPNPWDPTALFTEFFAFGDSVYWIRSVTDTSTSITSINLYTASVSNLSPGRLAGSVSPTMTIVDVNARSILLLDNSKLYRIPLPVGLGDQAPVLLTALSSDAYFVPSATEDTKGVYWLDTDGTLYICSNPSSCGNSKKVLVNGQSQSGSIYQDASAVYWATSTPSQILRLAK